jgi:hypothetical protein
MGYNFLRGEKGFQKWERKRLVSQNTYDQVKKFSKGEGEILNPKHQIPVFAEASTCRQGS